MQCNSDYLLGHPSQLLYMANVCPTDQPMVKFFFTCEGLCQRSPFREKFFFFYSTLMDLEALAAVFGSFKKPDFYKCYIIEYHTMLCCFGVSI